MQELSPRTRLHKKEKLAKISVMCVNKSIENAISSKYMEKHSRTVTLIFYIKN